MNPLSKPPKNSQLNFTALSKEVSAILASVNGLPETRESRVQEIRRSIEIGTYCFDPPRVAEAILGTYSRLIG